MSSYTNETIFWPSEKSLNIFLIIGGGPVGIEMAQAHRRLGCQITIIEAFTIMSRDDPVLVEKLKKHLKDEQIDLLENSTISNISRQEKSICIALADGHSVQGSHLLVAVGRRPNLERFRSLDAAKIDFTTKGITTDNRLRTSQKHIFAIGDVTGRHQFTHVAGYHAGIVIQNMLLRLPAKLKEDAIPWVTYTDPELAHVGLSWKEAVERYTESGLRRVDWELHKNDRALAERRTEGMVRVITTKNGQIFRSSILAPHAGEMIHVWALAVIRYENSGYSTNYCALSQLSEASKHVMLSGAFFTNQLFSNRIRRIVRFLLKFTKRKG